MARPTLTGHRKFRRLARVLGDDVAALGHLEWMWATAYADGNDYLGDSDDVESAAHWRGETGKLTHALLTAGGDECSGFIEEVSPGHYRVHDLWDHAPQYVSRRYAREQKRKANGASMASQCLDDPQPKSSTPTPAPTPTPKDQDLSPAVPAESARTDDGFKAFWEAYPRRIGKGDAEKAWKKLRPSLALQELILAAIDRQRRSRQWREDNGKYIPHPATWLRQKRWDDELEPDVRDLRSGPSHDVAEWDCPHDPHCGSRSGCETLQAIAATKAS